VTQRDITSPADEASPTIGVELPDREDIRLAAERIAPYVRHTPILEPEAGALGIPAALSLKLELLQVTGSFKARGAFARMLAADVRAQGVLAASGGNFGLAVARAARVLGHHAEIFVPELATPIKVERVRAEGAQIRIVPGAYEEAAAASRARAAETGALVLHPFDQPDIVAGQGTIGLELDEQVPGLDTVVAGVGGGGLTAGLAIWFGDRVRVIGVESDGTASLDAALRAGEPVEVPVSGLAADSLGAGRVGRIGLEVARERMDRLLLVSDDAIAETQRALWQELRLVAEPGGAAALAAVRSGAYRPSPGERVVVVLCGSNCDPGSVANG
jgi:threonine dehydratase